MNVAAPRRTRLLLAVFAACLVHAPADAQANPQRRGPDAAIVDLTLEGCPDIDGTRVRELVAARSNPSLTAFLERVQQRTAFMQHVAVKSKGRVRLVPVEQIDWFESSGNYVRLHVGSERFLLRQTMHGLEQKLDPAQFVRIHRATIVNLQRIRDTRPASHGDHVVVLHDGTQLQMSRAYRQRLDGSPQ